MIAFSEVIPARDRTGTRRFVSSCCVENLLNPTSKEVIRPVLQGFAGLLRNIQVWNFDSARLQVWNEH